MATLITKSIRLEKDENDILKQISQEEGVSEAAILRKFVRQGMSTYRLEQAVAAYTRGEADLSAAARYADVSVYQMMTELKRRDIAPPAETEKFVDGLKILVETFGGSEALRQTIADLEHESR
jgi:predicted HTH domain antitoxin